MQSDDPYAPPKVAPSAATPVSSAPPLKTDITIRNWVTALLVYPALVIGIPAIAAILSSRHITLGHMAWLLVLALLIGSIIIVRRARDKRLLLALPPILLAIGFTSALPALSLVISSVLVLILFFRIPKTRVGT